MIKKIKFDLKKFNFPDTLSSSCFKIFNIFPNLKKITLKLQKILNLWKTKFYKIDLVENEII